MIPRKHINVFLAGLLHWFPRPQTCSSKLGEASLSLFPMGETPDFPENLYLQFIFSNSIFQDRMRSTKPHSYKKQCVCQLARGQSSKVEEQLLGEKQQGVMTGRHT